MCALRHGLGTITVSAAGRIEIFTGVDPMTLPSTSTRRARVRVDADLARARAEDPAAVALARTRLAEGLPAGQQRGQRPIRPDDEDIEDTVIGADTADLDPGRHAAEVRDQHLRRVGRRSGPHRG